jgi:hypothetical protein
MEKLESFKHNNLVVNIYPDPDPINPRTDYDEMCTLVCWHRRYNLGDETVTPKDAKDIIRWQKAQGDRVLAILPLYLYEHGGMTMSTGGFTDPWDSGQVGWGYVTASAAEKFGCIPGKSFKNRETGKRERYTKKFFEEAIRSEVKVYDSYLTGECYGYIIEDEEGNFIDSCWGFLGDKDYCIAEGKSAAEHADTTKVDSDNTLHDVDVLGPDADREDKHPNMHACQFADGLLSYFASEEEACSFQRDWRKATGRDPMTGVKPAKK